MPPDVAAAFEAAPEPLRGDLRRLRSLILDVADDIGAAPVHEELKWGQPSYAAHRRSHGTAVRLGTTRDGELFGLYFHCRTSVVPEFRAVFPHGFRYDGNRAILFRPGDDLPTGRLRLCIEHALRYHVVKRR